MMKHTYRQTDVMLVNNVEKKYLTEKYDTSVNFQRENEECMKPYEGDKRLSVPRLLELNESNKRTNNETSKPVNMNKSDIVSPDVNYQYKSYNRTSTPLQLVKIDGSDHGNRTRDQRERYNMADERRLRRESKENIVFNRARRLSDSISSALSSFARRKGSRSFDLEEVYDEARNMRNGEMVRENPYETVGSGLTNDVPDQRQEFQKRFSDMNLNTRMNKESLPIRHSSNIHDLEAKTIVDGSKEGLDVNKAKKGNNICDETIALKNRNRERSLRANFPNSVVIKKAESLRSFTAVKFGFSSYSINDSIMSRERAPEQLINDCKVYEKPRGKFALPKLKKLKALKLKTLDMPFMTPLTKRKEVFNENQYYHRNYNIPTTYRSISEEYSLFKEYNSHAAISQKKNGINNNNSVSNSNDTMKTYNVEREIPAWKQTRQNHADIQRKYSGGVYRALKPHEISRDMNIQNGRPTLREISKLEKGFRSSSQLTIGSLNYGPNDITNGLNGSRVSLYSYDDDDDEDEDSVLNRTIEDIRPRPASGWSDSYGRRSFKNKLSGYTICKKYRFR